MLSLNQPERKYSNAEVIDIQFLQIWIPTTKHGRSC